MLDWFDCIDVLSSETIIVSNQVKYKTEPGDPIGIKGGCRNAIALLEFPDQFLMQALIQSSPIGRPLVGIEKQSSQRRVCPPRLFACRNGEIGITGTRCHSRQRIGKTGILFPVKNAFYAFPCGRNGRWYIL
jgi:hypothetical protein